MSPAPQRTQWRHWGGCSNTNGAIGWPAIPRSGTPAWGPGVSLDPAYAYVLASDAIRGSLERHFGVRLAFQNCHRVAAFRPDADPAVYPEFTAMRSEVLNRSPELRSC